MQQNSYRALTRKCTGKAYCNRNSSSSSYLLSFGANFNQGHSYTYVKMEAEARDTLGTGTPRFLNTICQVIFCTNVALLAVDEFSML